MDQTCLDPQTSGGLLLRCLQTMRKGCVPVLRTTEFRPHPLVVVIFSERSVIDVTKVHVWPRKDIWPFSGAFWGAIGSISRGFVGYGLIRKQIGWLRHIQRHLNTMSEYQVRKGCDCGVLSVLGKANVRTTRKSYPRFVAASDAEGVAVSGLASNRLLDVITRKEPEVWLQGDHPMLSQPRWPERPMGAMVVKQVPHHLVGLCDGEDFSWRGLQYAEWLRRCGVRE